MMFKYYYVIEEESYYRKRQRVLKNNITIYLPVCSS